MWKPSTVYIISRRRSIRTYTGEPLSKEHVNKLTGYISGLRGPFHTHFRIQLISAQIKGYPQQLGTYGYISGAQNFLALILRDEPMAEENGAYAFEQLILYCTRFRLGTCWLGGTFSRRDFTHQLALTPGEKLRIISPVGYPSERQRLLEFLIGANRHHHSRKPFGTNFYHKTFGKRLIGRYTGPYSWPLEMVRIAPSANNAQSCRLVVQDKTVHFYKTPSFGFSGIDAGIAMCHFEQTCRDLNIPGQWQLLNLPAEGRAKYVASWVAP
jgi:hypothetical protein